MALLSRSMNSLARGAAPARRAARSLAPAIRAYKDDAAPDASPKPQDAAPSAAGGPPAARAPAHVAAHAARAADLAAPFRVSRLFDDMEREMSALTRAFFGDDPFFSPAAAPAARRAGAPAAADPFAMLGGPPRGSAGGWGRLATDVAEDDKGYTLTADVPGMAPADLKVTLHDGVLSITGERRHEAEEEQDGGKLRWVERSYGSFRRAFALPEDADAEGTRARVRDGVVTVTVPKRPAAPAPKVREVPIEAEGAAGGSAGAGGEGGGAAAAGGEGGERTAAA